MAQAKRSIISFPVKPEQSEQIAEVAKWLGLSKSEYIRMCVFGENEYHRKLIAKAMGRNYK